MYDALAALGLMAFGGLVVTLIFLSGMRFDRYIQRFHSWEEFKNDFFK